MGLSLPGTMPIEDMQGGGVLAPKFSGSVQQPSFVEQALSSTTFPDLSVQTGTGTGTVLAPQATSGAGDYINQAIDMFTQQPTSTGGLGGLLGGLFSSDGLGDLTNALSGIYNIQQQQEYARNLGPTVQAQVEDLARRAGESAQFQPYTLTSTPGLGGVTMTEQGAQLSAGEPQARITEQALAGAETALQGLLAPREEREAQILQALGQAQAPEIERQRLGLEQRLFSQGRGGVTTSAYGGTPEQLAMEKAIQEQQAQNVLAAMNQAGAEQQQAQQLVGGLLGTAYTPQAQALNLLTGGTDFAKAIQSGRLSASEAMQVAIPKVAEATMSGEQLAARQAEQLLQAYAGLLSPTIQTAGQAIGAQDIATQIGEAVQGGLGDLYDMIF